MTLPYVTRKAIDGYLSLIPCKGFEQAVASIQWIFCNGMLIANYPNGEHARYSNFRTRGKIYPLVLVCEKEKKDVKLREFRVLEVRFPTETEKALYEREMAKTREILGRPVQGESSASERSGEKP